MIGIIGSQEQCQPGDLIGPARPLFQRLSAIREFYGNLHFLQIFRWIGIVVDIRGNRTRADSIDADFVLCELQGCHFHKSDLSGFCRTVCRKADIREDAVAVN
ncbi:hypothetical protein D3C73_1393250 [compost metagenome]